MQQLNKPPGGQTPFSDFQQAWEELNEELKAKLVRKGLRYERRYYNDKARKPIDPLQSKSWQDMFMTESKEEVEEMARQEEFEPVWEDNDNLLLTHTAIVNRTHNGKSVWNTHFNVLHANSFGVPFAQSAQILDSKISLFLSWLIPTFNAINRWRGYEYGHDLVFADDHSQVTYKEALQIRNAISRNTWIFDWNEGDVLILDNRRIAHGRLPYFYGTRKVYVAWQ